NYLSKNQPVIVRGMAKDWPASSKWSYQYISDTLSETSALVTAK
ncbi:MAG: cupin-like domain-containing protein, partial [Flammeovirgaceae bacterium]